jgi:hypothetical protein
MDYLRKCVWTVHVHVQGVIFHGLCYSHGPDGWANRKGC